MAQSIFISQPANMPLHMEMEFSPSYGFEPFRRCRPSQVPEPEQVPPSNQPSEDSEDSCFRRGSYIELSSGAVRRVEDIRTEDFIQSALRSQLFELREATVVRINRAGSPHHVTITFSYDSQCAKFQVNMEVLPGHPLFVYGQGWASCDPQLSLQLYELRCQQLQVGDICLSLVPREQPVAPVAPPPPPPVSLHSHEAPAMEYPLLADSPPAGSFGGLPPMRNPYQVYAQMANFVAAYTQHMIDKMQN